MTLALLFHPPKLLWDLAVVQVSSVAHVLSAQAEVVRKFRCLIFREQLVGVGLIAVRIEADPLLAWKMNGQRQHRWTPAGQMLLLDASRSLQRTHEALSFEFQYFVARQSLVVGLECNGRHVGSLLYVLDDVFDALDGVTIFDIDVAVVFL